MFRFYLRIALWPIAMFANFLVVRSITFAFNHINGPRDLRVIGGLLILAVLLILDIWFVIWRAKAAHGDVREWFVEVERALEDEGTL